jgi:hypothetical protein
VRSAYLLLAATLATGLAACGGSGTTTNASSAAAPAAASSAAAPAGNGIADKKPDEILTATRAALAAASSVRLKGSVAGASPMALDLQIGKGLTGRGTITMGAQKMELLRQGSVVYVRGNAALYGSDAPKGAEKLFLRTTTKDPKVADFAQLLDLKAVADNIIPKGAAGLTLGQQVTLRDVPAVPLKDKGDTLFVSTVGEPRPLQIDSGANGRIDFLEYDVPVTVTAPAAKDVLDLG